MDNGYIKLHRKFKEWEWYKNINVKTLFLHCLIMANFKDNKWQGIEIKRGSFITSIKNLSNETGLSGSQVRTALNKLVLTNELANKSTTKYSTITVLKYNEYQTNDKQVDKPIANKSQTNRKQIATTNKDKNLKNEKNVIKEDKEKPVVKRFVIPTVKELEEYCKERKNNVNPNKFFDFYESKGWLVGKNKMKNWKAAVRTWENNNNTSTNGNNKEESIYDYLPKGDN